MEFGTATWATAATQAVNASDDYHERAAGWRWPLGLAFLGGDDTPDRYVRLDLWDGACRGADVVDERDFDDLPFRMIGTYDRWGDVLKRERDPMRCILLGRIRVEGDKLTTLRYMPAAKSLLAALATVQADAPAAS